MPSPGNSSRTPSSTRPDARRLLANAKAILEADYPPPNPEAILTDPPAWCVNADLHERLAGTPPRRYLEIDFTIPKSARSKQSHRLRVDYYGFLALRLILLFGGSLFVNDNGSTPNKSYPKMGLGSLGGVTCARILAGANDLQEADPPADPRDLRLAEHTLKPSRKHGQVTRETVVRAAVSLFERHAGTDLGVDAAEYERLIWLAFVRIDQQHGPLLGAFAPAEPAKVAA